MSAPLTDEPELTRIYAAYWEALATKDAWSAWLALEQGLAQGHSARTLARDVLARAQVEVGRRWESGECTVADEHAASAIAEQTLAALRRSSPYPDGAAARVVLACPEGEWHTFPARLAADLAQHSGVELVMLGGSCPPEHLGRFLAEQRATALALSVTMTVNLVSAGQAIRAAHLVGVPVVVGGAAWGHNRHRAERLGADLWLEDPAQLSHALRLLDEPSRPLPPPSPWHAELDHLAGWGDRFGRSSSVETLLVRAAASALACDDRSILLDMRSWMTRARALGALDDAGLAALGDRLAMQVQDEAPSTAALLGSAR